MNKSKEHRSCGCPACKRGAGSTYGQIVHQQTNRRIRRQTKLGLAKLVEADTFMPVKSGTPYTD